MSNHYNDIMHENCYENAVTQALKMSAGKDWTDEEIEVKAEEIYQELLDNYPEI